MAPDAHARTMPAFLDRPAVMPTAYVLGITYEPRTSMSGAVSTEERLRVIIGRQ